MSYIEMAQMASDSDLRMRIMAAYACTGGSHNPSDWADRNMWRLVATEGWSDAITSGENGSGTYAISDEMLQRAVKDAVAAEQ